jgi:hypothetical protein
MFNLYKLKPSFQIIKDNKSYRSSFAQVAPKLAIFGSIELIWSYFTQFGQD